MKIPEYKIEEVRSAANIVDLISESVQLRKRGKNFIGLCPFHNEKTPSFTVSEEKQIFHCFGCHTGGNVFTFMMNYQRISFVEAVQELAQKLGIQLEVEEGVSDQKQSEQELLYDINSIAGRYFCENLLNHPEGEIARSYFNTRKIKTQTIRSFGLGYSLNGWESFVNFAREQKIDQGKAEALGLIIKSDDGKYFDRFKGRIMFPVFSPNGRVVAFGGRIMEKSDNTAKYINSPESIIYVKGRTLYGLSHAKNEIRKENKAILVEGYMDLISLFQNGIQNVVASSGTALTTEQVQLLSRYTRNVVLVFDADAAGIKASLRSIELLLKQDMEVKILSLPQGEDPDSYVNKFGKNTFLEIVSKAPNFLEFQSSYFEKEGMFEDPAKQAVAIRELVESAALVNDELKRNLLIKSIAKKFNLREKLIESELEKVIKKNSLQQGRESKVQTGIRENKPNIKLNSSMENNSGTESVEREVACLLLEGDKKIIGYLSEYISPDDFSNRIFQKLAGLVFQTFKDKEDITPGALLEKLMDDELQSYIISLSMEKYELAKKWDELSHDFSGGKNLIKQAVDAVKRFKFLQIDREIRNCHQLLTSAQSEEERFSVIQRQKQLFVMKKNIEEEFVYKP